MAGPAQTFREIHRLRRYARDLQEQLDRLPRQRKAHQAKLARQEQALKDEQEAIKRLKLAATEKEKTIRQKGELIARYEAQMNTVSTKREMDALRLEIAHNQGACSQLEEEVLAAILEGEERTAKLPEAERLLAQVREDVAKFEADATRREADLKAQLTEATGQLKGEEAKLPPDLMPMYQRTMASLGADGLAEVQDRNCTSCNTEITLQMKEDLQYGRFVLCRSCGRILYLPEGALLRGEDDEE
jgi:predicted  nucleic acid-binding Zn-ribbon protein